MNFKEKACLQFELVYSTSYYFHAFDTALKLRGSDTNIPKHSSDTINIQAASSFTILYAAILCIHPLRRVLLLQEFSDGI